VLIKTPADKRLVKIASAEGRPCEEHNAQAYFK
jgi:hypothetical protein